MKKKIIVVSGYFNPLHKGHIEYFHNAKSCGDLLFVIINNDSQRKLKGSINFMDEDERKIIIKELAIVDKAILSIDTDKTVCKTLIKISEEYSKEFQIFFANGGDQDNSSIPEKNTCNKFKIKLIDGLGSKIQSSSWILKK
jgi:D-beta-D-heptose 7-phosphate kinase/D-beta-D-heptose 1-phosphate adenosyltransferase